MRGAVTDLEIRHVEGEHRARLEPQRIPARAWSRERVRLIGVIHTDVVRRPKAVVALLAHDIADDARGLIKRHARADRRIRCAQRLGVRLVATRHLVRRIADNDGSADVTDITEVIADAVDLDDLVALDSAGVESILVDDQPACVAAERADTLAILDLHLADRLTHVQRGDRGIERRLAAPRHFTHDIEFVGRLDHAHFLEDVGRIDPLEIGQTEIAQPRINARIVEAHSTRADASRHQRTAHRVQRRGCGLIGKLRGQRQLKAVPIRELRVFTHQISVVAHRRRIKRVGYDRLFE